MLIKSLLIITCVFLSGCGVVQQTENIYFDCSETATTSSESDTDKQKLIYEILKKALVVDKDVPDYNRIEDNNHIYISNTTPDSFFRFFEKGKELRNDPLEVGDIPFRIGNVELCLKTVEELQFIADETDDFIYIALGNIQSEDHIGKIGISTNWITQSGTTRTYLSGGGYMAEYIREPDGWKFSRITESWSK